MDPINISTLFSDILPDPAAEMRQKGAERVNLTQTLGGVAAYQQPELERRLRLSAGGLFGVDTRTASEKLREQLSSAMQDTSPTGMIKLANLIQQSNPEKALQLRTAAAQQEKQTQVRELEATRQQNYRDTVARRAAASPRYKQDAMAISQGIFPQSEIEEIYSELTKEEEAQDLEPLQLIMPDGTQQTAFYDDKGNFYDVTNPSKKLNLAEGTQVLRSSQVGGATDYSNPQEIALRQSHLDTSQFVSSVNNVVRALEENPDANTAAGKVAGVINNIIQEAEAVINLNEEGGRKKLIDKLELGRASAEMQSMLIGLAYQAAKAEGQKGRDVSNADIERFMRQLGANSSDPVAIINNVKRLSTEAQSRFTDRYLFTRNQKWEGSFEPPAPETTTGTTTPVPAGVPNFGL